MGQVPMTPRISVDQPVDSHQDPGATREILQSVDPVALLVSFLDAHSDVVAQELRASSPVL